MKDICIHTNTKVTFYERYLHIKSHKRVWVNVVCPDCNERFKGDVTGTTHAFPPAWVRQAVRNYEKAMVLL